MKDESKLARLFRTRLEHASMDVREGFWEELRKDLPPAPSAGKKSSRMVAFRRMMAAASVVLVLGIASAVFWHFSSLIEVEKDATSVHLDRKAERFDWATDRLQESVEARHTASSLMAQEQSVVRPVAEGGRKTLVSSSGEENTMSIHVSITIHQQRSHQRHAQEHHRFFPGWTGYYNGNMFPQASHRQILPDSSENTDFSSDAAATEEENKNTRWAWQVAMGTSLPKGDCQMPVRLAATVERKLGKRVGLETGLQYSYMPMKGETDLHALAVPLKLNVLLANTPRLDFYAMVGGTAEKTLNASFREDPICLSAQAGVGVRYRLNDRFALFAEPSVSHCFDTDTEMPSLRTERATNMNLLCGVRMTY